jgi:hypothetical protein
MRIVLGALIVAAGLPTLARADACGGLLLENGVVTTARRLTARLDVPKPELECVAELGAALKARRARSVTVAVRLPDALRAGGQGLQIGAKYQAALVLAGVPEARISVVVPVARPDEAGTVKVTYTEGGARSPVAIVEEAGGRVDAGPSADKLEPVTRGAPLTVGTVVSTGAGAAVWLGLADGSRIRLGPNASIRLGKLHLNAKLARVVELELLRGEIETRVAAGANGSVFDVRTPSGVAGVRGTQFRVSTGEADEMRLSTLEGRVAVTAKDTEVTVPAGQRVRVVAGQPPSPPGALLEAPLVDAPLQGALPADRALRWRAVSGAARHQVELARDAEFTFDVRTFEAAADTLPMGAELPSGKWFWRVAGVDAEGFVGRTSRVYAFEP